MTTRVVSYSETDTYRQCRYKHQLAYIERWGIDETSPALTRGTAFHSMMEAHYDVILEAQKGGGSPALKPGWTPELVLEKAKEDVMRGLVDSMTLLGLAEDQFALLEWMYDGYVQLNSWDPAWEIVATEDSIESWLPTRKGGRSRIKLTGTIDLTVRDHSAGGGLWIVDHKTCRNLPRGKDLDMEDQTGIYTYLKRRQGFDVRGAIYNHCRTEKLKSREMGMDERFRRTLTVRTPEELRTMALEVYMLMREAYAKREGDAPRTPDGERCGWKCSFTEPCLLARKGKPTAEAMDSFGFTVRQTKPGPTFQNRAAAGIKE